MSDFLVINALMGLAPKVTLASIKFLGKLIISGMDSSLKNFDTFILSFIVWLIRVCKSWHSIKLKYKLF